MNIKKVNFIGVVFFMVMLIACSQPNKEIQVLPAHSHNDYEHERPLLDALDCHFKSIEADIYSIGDSLYVSHNEEDIKPGRTLRKMYLDPLKKKVKENNGSVYGSGEEIILFIDIKDDAKRTYTLLDKILEDYQPMLTVFQNGKKKKGSIMVVVSGNRPFDLMKAQKIRFAGYDGRLPDLDKDILPNLMPVVSNSWGEYFTWNGTGEMDAAEKTKLKEFADRARNEGYILRFWGTPNKTPEQKLATWKILREAGVGLIGADDLKGLQQFFISDN